jgi:hypothetical protein
MTRIHKHESTAYDRLIFVYSHDVGLRIHPNHHHLSAQSRLRPTAILQSIRQLRILRGEVPKGLLVHLVVVESVDVSYFCQFARFFGEHCLQAVGLAVSVEFSVGLPLVSVSLFEQFQFFLGEDSLGVLVFLLDCGEGVEAVEYVQHVEAFVLEE